MKTAMAVIPKRVIFWTTPYKQLYKDPALLVRVKDQVETVENLATTKSVSEPFQARVVAGIKDAETKNEGLWKFYVFLSDGLFFTGSLSKLLTGHKCGVFHEEHIKCLEASQDIVVRGLRTAWEFWEASRRKPTPLNLSTQISVEEFQQLLEVFRTEALTFKLYQSDLPKKVSEVALKNYLHGGDLAKCRDIRYKYDSSANLEKVLEQIPSEKRQLIAETIQLLKLPDKRLAMQELSEFASRLARRLESDQNFENALSNDLLNAVAARGRSPIDAKRLRALWLGSLTPGSLLSIDVNE